MNIEILVNWNSLILSYELLQRASFYTSVVDFAESKAGLAFLYLLDLIY
jgi:hypothetical protein